MKNSDTATVETTFRIEGITCTGCVTDMENILLDTDGINDASIDYAKGLITISYNPDEIDEKKLINKVEKLGFPTKKI